MRQRVNTNANPLAGADKVSIDTAAVRNPSLIVDGAARFGRQCIVLGMQVQRVGESPQIPSGYEVYIEGARTPTGLDAVRWAHEAEELGCGEICLNSIDADGTQEGYDLKITQMVSETVKIPVIASGGAGKPEHLRAVLAEARADAALVASMVHFGTYSIAQIKGYLAEHGVGVRMDW